MIKLADCRVAVIGLGLMGGSLALAVRGHCREVVGVSRSPGTLAYAREQGIVDRTTTLPEAVQACEVIILAAPVRTILRQLQLLADISLSPPRSKIILDLGSTKTDIVAAMQNLPPGFDPLGGHPMCGKEVSGIRAAESGLYRHKLFILSPLARTSPAALAVAHELIAVLGARPLELAAERQDALVALISHLPYVAAQALVRTALACGDAAVWTVAASGFRDTSRVAASDLTMMLDILLTNRAAVLTALAGYRAELDLLTAAIENADEPALRAVLAPAQAQRAQMFK